MGIITHLVEVAAAMIDIDLNIIVTAIATALPPTIAALAAFLVALRTSKVVNETSSVVKETSNAVNGRMSDIKEEARVSAAIVDDMKSAEVTALKERISQMEAQNRHIDGLISIVMSNKDAADAILASRKAGRAAPGEAS